MKEEEDEQLLKKNENSPISSKRPSSSSSRADVENKHPSGTNLHSSIVRFEQPTGLKKYSSIHVFYFLLFQFFTLIASFILYGAVYLKMGFENSNDLILLVSVFMGVCVWKISIIFTFYIKFGNEDVDMKKAFFFEGLNATGFLIVTTGLLLYLLGILDPFYLFLFAIPLIVFSILPIFVGADELPLTYSPFIMLLESLQIFYIAIKFGNSEEASWTWVLTFYTIAAILHLLISSLLCVAALLSLLAHFLKENIFSNFQSSTILTAFTIAFYYCWSGIVYFFVFDGLRRQLERDMVRPHPPKGGFSTSLISMGWVMIICGLINLILLFITYKKTEDALLKMFSQRTPHDLTIISLIKDFNFYINDMDHRRKSSGSFNELRVKKRTSVDSRQPDFTDGSHKEICHICHINSSEVLLEPCMHNAICKQCFLNLSEGYRECPFCGKNVDQAVYLEWNDTEQKYFRTGYFAEAS